MLHSQRHRNSLSASENQTALQFTNLYNMTLRQREPRLHDPKFLAFLRTKPCCVCGKAPPSEACHIRMGLTGMQRKPDDSKAVPMCTDHHVIQHSMTEYGFWLNQHQNPFDIAAKLYREYGGTGGKPAPRRKIKPREPKELRQKIQSRGFPKRRQSR